MPVCKHECPGCGRHQKVHSIVVRVAPVDPAVIAREVRRQLRRLGRGGRA